MKYLNWRTLVFIGLVTGILLLSSIPVDAQCSMCRAVLTGSNNGRFIKNFNIGVLVLLVPPVSIFCSIFIVLRRHRGEGVISNLDEPES
jgi:hypothetical protein